MLSQREIEVLRSILLLETPTRTEIAQFTHLSTVSISSLLAGLRRKSLVEPSGKAQSSMGRPSITYRHTADVGCSIGVFFESSFCQLVAIDATGSEILERDLPLILSSRPDEHPSEILRQVSAAVEEFIADESVRHRRVLAMGVAPPGMVDTLRGVWLHGLRLSGIEHVELSALLEQKLGRPVLLEDGARCLCTWLSVTSVDTRPGTCSSCTLAQAWGLGWWLGASCTTGSAVLRVRSVTSSWRSMESAAYAGNPAAWRPWLRFRACCEGSAGDWRRESSLASRSRVVQATS
jgi:hypothetical protein